MYLSIEEFIDKAEKQEKISDLMIEQEMERSQKAMKKFGHRWVKIWMLWMLLSNARKKEQAFFSYWINGW